MSRQPPANSLEAQMGRLQGIDWSPPTHSDRVFASPLLARLTAERNAAQRRADKLTRAMQLLAKQPELDELLYLLYDDDQPTEENK